ncbi:ArsR family transcriptional regulator [Arthrobacter bambusae]|uniref:ArsR family transcriptional regulator n=1 Tax=Arthrobacter bambusae TaxID=1338426 RepID=UPI003520D242
MIDTHTRHARAVTVGDGVRPLRTQQIRNRIVDHLRKHGASRISEICIATNSTRNSVQHHIAALEAEGIIRSDIPAGQRAGCTPFYFLVDSAQAAR